MEATRSRRSKKLSAKLNFVSEEDKTQAISTRLEALENDDAMGEDVAANSDDNFQPSASEDELTIGDSRRKKRKRGSGTAKRKTRAAQTGQRGPKTFANLLEEADLQALPEGQPSYLTVAAGPPKSTSARKWCSICGFAAPYKCVRCASRFCSRKCNAVHAETRCLKFTT